MHRYKKARDPEEAKKCDNRLEELQQEMGIPSKTKKK
jgi:hypothetical protein